MVKLNKLLPKTYLKITSANSTFLKISDANAQFLKISDADQRYLPAPAANSFIQGNGNVVSGTLSNLTTSPQQLLTLAGGTFALKVTDVPGAGRVIAIHNATPNALGGAADMGDGLASSAFTLTPNADTQLPAVQANAAEIRLQIFPGGTFTGVVSILIGLTPVPGTSQVEAVAQAFTGGV